MRSEIPDLDLLLSTVRGRATGLASEIHGDRHWRRVAHTAADILAEEGRGDPAVVFLFALLHDSLREHDGFDLAHGPRAAQLARELHGGAHALPADRLELLVHACHEHTSGLVSGDPTIGACWDADRLDLWRVGVEPDPTLLSTPAGRRPGRIAAGRDPGEPPSWQATYERLLALGSGVNALTSS